MLRDFPLFHQRFHWFCYWPIKLKDGTGWLSTCMNRPLQIILELTSTHAMSHIDLKGKICIMSPKVFSSLTTLFEIWLVVTGATTCQIQNKGISYKQLTDFYAFCDNWLQLHLFFKYIHWYRTNKCFLYKKWLRDITLGADIVIQQALLLSDVITWS